VLQTEQCGHKKSDKPAFEYSFYLDNKHNTSIVVYISPRTKALSDIDTLAIKILGAYLKIALELRESFIENKLTTAVNTKKRLAQDLHDEVTQTLFSANLITHSLEKLWEHSPNKMLENIATLKLLIGDAHNDLRELIFNLSNKQSSSMEFGAQVQEIIQRFSWMKGLQIEMNLQHIKCIPEAVKDVFCQIIRESLNNIIKHAAASKATILLEKNGNLIRLFISDNGRGFVLQNINRSTLGLGIMRERAASIDGRLTITSRANTGTNIELSWLINTHVKSSEYRPGGNHLHSEETLHV